MCGLARSSSASSWARDSSPKESTTRSQIGGVNASGASRRGDFGIRGTLGPVRGCRPSRGRAGRPRLGRGRPGRLVEPPHPSRFCSNRCGDCGRYRRAARGFREGAADRRRRACISGKRNRHTLLRDRSHRATGRLRHHGGRRRHARPRRPVARSHRRAVREHDRRDPRRPLQDARHRGSRRTLYLHSNHERRRFSRRCILEAHRRARPRLACPRPHFCGLSSSAAHSCCDRPFFTRIRTGVSWCSHSFRRAPSRCVRH